MAYQAGPIEELVQYKKDVLRDERRDSRIRGSIEATLQFLSNRRSSLLNNLNSNTNSRPAAQDPFSGPTSSRSSFESFTKPRAMVYPQISRPMPTTYKHDEVLGRQMMSEKNDMEVQSVSMDKKPDPHHHEPFTGELSWKGRLKHFTFAWYAMTMSTGGIALVLSVIPNRFDGLTALGTGVFIINLMMFTAVTATMILRFMTHTGTLKKSLANPHEGFFFATFWLTIATIMNNTVAYGVPNSGPWLPVALRVAFWTYTICTTLLAIIHYHVIFTVKKLVITNVLPGWVLPIFPAMLVGTLASAIAKTQPAEHAYPMLVAGLSYQGLGMILAIGMYGIYFGRLMAHGLPADMSRPAMFIAVGPPSFTALAFIGMAQDVQSTKIFAGYTRLNGVTDQTLIPDILSIGAIVCAIFLWTLAFWFFGIALVATIEAIPRNDFHLNWYAYVFPNVGFTISAIKIGERLSSPAIQLVGTGMGAVLFFLWILIVFCHIKAVKNKMIMWPGKDEDAH